MQIVFLCLLFVLGACLGSFLCCQARRLHLKSKKTQPLGSRSVCLSCKYKLKWYDNIPIFSWLFLKGKCRKCGKKIGLAEFLSEIGLATAFLLFGFGVSLNGLTLDAILVRPAELAVFGLTLTFIVGLAFLAIYDGIYGQLPLHALIFCLICAVIIVVLREWGYFSSPEILRQNLINIFFAVLILGGLYLALYLISKGKWVGDGDWILGAILALVLGTPWLALITLFLANFIACITMAPIVKKDHHKKIYFGPFMAIAFIIVFSFSAFFNSLLG
ncbi:prepilin peptidase [Candidatus Saccharibacteria bacterium]|nr:prepilin peptidase [Candidatus Saccharibacteria bacterium]